MDIVGGVMDKYEYKRINEIKPSDKKFCLVGKIRKKLDGRIVLEDEQAEIELEGEFEVKEGEFVRVFCSKANSHFKIDFLQKISQEELNLFKRFLSLYKMVKEYV